MTVPQPKSEAEYIESLRSQISVAASAAAEKVNQSAFSFMADKKKWISEADRAEAEAFFLKKIPKVLSNEIEKSVSEALGLTPVGPGSDSTTD